MKLWGFDCSVSPFSVARNALNRCCKTALIKYMLEGLLVIITFILLLLLLLLFMCVYLCDYLSYYLFISNILFKLFVRPSLICD